MTKLTNEPNCAAVGLPLDLRVERLEPERDDADDGYYDDDQWCDRCNNDGRDPWTDYLLPCPACQGEQRP